MTSLPFNSEFPEPHDIYKDYMPVIDELHWKARHKGHLDIVLGVNALHLCVTAFFAAEQNYLATGLFAGLLVAANGIERAALRQSYEDHNQK